MTLDELKAARLHADYMRDICQRWGWQDAATTWDQTVKSLDREIGAKVAAG